ncbi:MAG: CaiB/BaiF CoA transferase family protein, partial [Rhodospirillales bacterium]
MAGKGTATGGAKPVLAGVRVLDLSRVVAGPWAAMTLGDLGAEVIKVENPAGGDEVRLYGPPFEAGESAYYLCVNRNKKSLLADLKTAEGQAIVRELARVSDVLVENFRDGTMERFGLGLEGLRAETPRLVTCSISGYGRDSPMSARAGYDFIIQGESGLMSIIGDADGPPMKVGVAVSDILCAHNAVAAILAALLARERTGKGQHVDMALLDASVQALGNQGANYLMTGEPPRRYGNAHANVVPYQPFETADKPITVAAANDRQFRILCRVLGRPELADDARFAGNAKRVENRDALVPVLAGIFATAGRDDWLEKLHAAGLPAGAIRAIDEVLEAPEVVARGMVTAVAHPAMGSTRLVASPLKLSETPVVEPTHPPTLGEHTAAVLEAVL